MGAALALLGIAALALLALPAARETIAGGVFSMADRQAFLKALYQAADGEDLAGIPAEFLAAIAAHETGWGAGNVFRQTANYFSITVGKWKGPVFLAASGYVFRKYPGGRESVRDFVALISKAPRYAKAKLAGQRRDAAAFFRELAAAGYGDPNDGAGYATKLERVLADVRSVV